jgi:hypothetical protein
MEETRGKRGRGVLVVAEKPWPQREPTRVTVTEGTRLRRRGVAEMRKGAVTTAEWLKMTVRIEARTVKVTAAMTTTATVMAQW